MSDGRLRQTMLLDFYGELLTQRQRLCFDMHFNEDLSLSEIAEQCGISRQGVWENIRRAESALEDIEAKTGLVRRFEEQRQALETVRKQLEELTRNSQGGAARQSMQILREVEDMIARG